MTLDGEHAFHSCPKGLLASRNQAQEQKIRVRGKEECIPFMTPISSLLLMGLSPSKASGHRTCWVTDALGWHRSFADCKGLTLHLEQALAEG